MERCRAASRGAEQRREAPSSVEDGDLEKVGLQREGAAEDGWWRRAKRSGQGRGVSGSSAARGQRKTGGGGGPRGQAGDEEKVGLQRRGGSGRRVAGEGQEVRPGMRRKWVFSSEGAAEDGWWGRGGSRRRWGGGGLRCQTGDEEELVGMPEGRSPPTGVRVGVATNCYDACNERRQERRGEKKEEKRVVFSRAGELSVYISGSTSCLLILILSHAIGV